MSNFTPEQVQEILDLYFENFAHRQYIGARYVPIFGRKGETSIEWDNSAPYEPLTIVLYQGNSYTSRQFVPTGVAITNELYWAETGNFNAQIEQYRQEVLAFDGRISALEDSKVSSLMSEIYTDFPQFITDHPDAIVIVDDGSYEFDTDVTIPGGITLVPEGGIISTTASAGITLRGKVASVRQQIFANDIALVSEGYENNVAYPEWFGAVANDATKTSVNNAAFNKALSVFDTVELARADYYVSDTVAINESNKSLIGSEHNTSVSSIICVQTGLPVIKIGSETAAQTDVVSNICIDNVNVLFSTPGTTRDSIGVLAVSAINIRLDNMFIKDAGVCVKASNLVYSRFDNVYCEPSSTGNSIGFYFTDIAAWYFGVGSNASLYINHCNVTPATFNGNAYAMHFDGRGIADTFVDQFECSNCGYCVNIDTSNSTSLEANSDVHFNHIISEQIPRAIFISGVPIPLQMYITNCYFCGKWDSTDNELVSIYPGYSDLALTQIVIDGCLFVVSSNNTTTKGIIAHCMGLQVANCMFRYMVECVSGKGNYNSFDINVYNNARTAASPYVDFDGYYNTITIQATADSANPVATYAIAGELLQSTFYLSSCSRLSVGGFFDTSYSQLVDVAEFVRNSYGNTVIA